MVLSYVDECVYWYTFEAIVKWFVNTLGERLHVNFLEYTHWFMSVRIYHIKDHFISMDQARYAASIVAKYLDTDTVKAGTTFYKTTFPYDIIFTKDDPYTSDEQVEKLTREFNIHYRSYIGSLIYLLCTRVDLSFVVQKFKTFSSNTGKVHFEILVHILRYIRNNKTRGLKCYAGINDSPVTDLLRQDSIKTENHLMDFSDSSWQDCLYTGRVKGSYIIFCQ